jgi:glycosyl-4,4'-diaponeurosporenoate acyltransferase
MFFCFPVFFTWNPPWACWVMVGYAIFANAPCIIAQRYNRLILTKLVNSCCLT